MTTAATSAQAPARRLRVEDLQARNLRELEQLYREAPEPREVRGLDGTPQGTMLATAGLDWKPVAQVLRAFNDSQLFPWLGKGFSSEARESGTGNNRLNILGYETERFSFTTCLDDSVLDGRRCILLNYDHPGNPAPIRRIRDELREVSPGLFFGPALVRLGGGYHTVLYFSLDFSRD